LQLKLSLNSWCIFDLPTKENELVVLQLKSEDPDLWDDPSHAQKIMKKTADLRSEINGWLAIQKRIQESIELAELDDETLRPELEKETVEIEAEASKRELNTRRRWYGSHGLGSDARADVPALGGKTWVPDRDS
jgi:hypothetical protein